MRDAGGESGEPAPANIVRWAVFLSCRGSSRRESQGLDDLPTLGAPEPGAPGNEGVRNTKRQGATREREAILDQMRAEFRQQSVGTRGLRGRIDEPGERRRKLHEAIVGLTHHPCHEISLTKGLSAAILAAHPRRHR
jgi:hypothetical protein